MGLTMGERQAATKAIAPRYRRTSCWQDNVAYDPTRHRARQALLSAREQKT